MARRRGAREKEWTGGATMPPRVPLEPQRQTESQGEALPEPPPLSADAPDARQALAAPGPGLESLGNATGLAANAQHVARRHGKRWKP